MTTTAINLIEYIGVIGFHHSLGHRIEFLYPDVDEETKGLYNWNILPFYCIYDGAHNSFEDCNFFIMEEINPDILPAKRLYGLSYYKQKSKRDLPKSAISIEDTRSTIQKSVVILSKFPIFNSFKTQLSSATICYFNQGDFGNTDILKTWFHAQNNEFKERNNEKMILNNSFGYQMNQVVDNNSGNGNDSNGIPFNNSTISISSEFLFGSMSLKKFIMHFGRNSLVMFKLLMLERGVVVFCSQPVSPICESIVSLLSLFPKSYDLLVSQNQSISNQVSIDWTSSTSSEMVLNQLGLPIPLFNDNGIVLQPYLPLQQMNLLLPPQDGKSFRGYLVGTSNSLFIKSPPSTVHAILDIQSGEIEFRDESLKPLLELTSSDRRFIDNVFDKVELYNKNGVGAGNGNGSNALYKEGCDQWIRDQFENYIVCLLSSICRFVKYEDGNNVITNMDQMAVYNDQWVRRWTTTKNFYLWKKQMFANLPLPQLNYPVHPSGPPSDSLDKLQDKFTSSIKNLTPLANQFTQLFSFSTSLFTKQQQVSETITVNSSGSNEQQQSNIHVLKTSFSQEFINVNGNGGVNSTLKRVQENSMYAANKAVSVVKPYAKQFSSQIMNYIAPPPSSDISIQKEDNSNNSLFESPPNNEFDFIGSYYTNNNNNSNSNSNNRNNNNNNFTTTTTSTSKIVGIISSNDENDDSKSYELPSDTQELDDVYEL